MKTRVNLGLSYISIPEKIQNMRLYATNLDAYPSDFPNAHPSSALLNPAAADLETAYANAQNGGINETALLRDKERIADAYVTELSHYTEDLPNCIPDLLHKLGMKERLTGGKSAVIFEVKQGANTGEATLHTKSVSGAAYFWKSFKGATPPLPDAIGDQGWQDLGISSRKAVFMASGLQMEVKYWFIAAPIIGQTIGDWETPISIILV